MLYWQIGKRINEEILKNQRAEYGKQIVQKLSEQLTLEYGKGGSEKHSPLPPVDSFSLYPALFTFAERRKNRVSQGCVIFKNAWKIRAHGKYRRHHRQTQCWKIYLIQPAYRRAAGDHR